MWLYAFYATGLLHLTNAVLEKHNNAREEAIFADVIRNISRVNNVLQELISNYEQLQKIYKSHENTEKDYSSDTEIDEVFKSINKAKIDLKKKAKFTSTDKPINAGSFPATKMIWSEDNDDDDGDDINDTSKEKYQTETVGRLPKTESLQAKYALKDDTFENTSSESTESMRNTSISKPKEAKIIFIDTHKKIEAIKENKNISPFKIENTTKKPKTTYDKVSKHNKANMKARKSKSNNTLNISNDTKGIKKVIYAEKFSPKSIWKEIIKNKPIQLEPQKEITYDTPKKRSVYNPNVRNDAGKTALVIVTNHNLKGMKSKEKDTFESSEDETIAKEIFKTNVLRHAYGDACSIVVVKKCYKACRHAGKSYCTLYKCKSEFRSKFKELSKTGCIREFLEPTSNKSDVRYRRQDDVFIDATRDRFLDAACLPHVGFRHKPISRNDTAQFKTKPLSRYDKTINILRDRYERACQKASARKCTSACNFAYTNTCDAFKCEKKRRKNFKKYCKQQCEILYKVDSDSDSSDTDGSSISSDTNTS